MLVYNFKNLPTWVPLAHARIPTRPDRAKDEEVYACDLPLGKFDEAAILACGGATREVLAETSVHQQELSNDECRPSPTQLNYFNIWSNISVKYSITQTINYINYYRSQYNI